MISEKKNGLERRLMFKPGYHKVDEGYGVHGLSLFFVLIGPKGACHYIQYTGMMLNETYEWWKEKGLHEEPYKMHMGADIGYHSPHPQWEGQEPVWPTKMRKTGPGPLEVEFDKIGDAPPVCEYLGVPCYSDGSALRAEQIEQLLIKEGDEAVWKVLEEDYKELFGEE